MRMKRLLMVVAGGLALMAVFFALARFLPRVLEHADGPPVESTSDFLARHWAEPIPPQGKPPEWFSPIEASLAPESCGLCHVQQFDDWRSSLHSRTIGTGILWQFHVMDQADANACMHCHAPLAEQKALMALEMGWSNVPPSPPPAYVSHNLHRQGLICAGCHVRAHVHYGPIPRKERTSPISGRPAHGGFQISAAFEDSRFCAACHQFTSDGASLNGKLLENTYEEWRTTRYAREGESCQSCHMPDRRHLWRGIHDPEMVRRALNVDLKVVRRSEVKFEALVVITNIGAGHHFPTYLVPEVEVGLYLIGADGANRRLLTRRVIGRLTDTALKREVADTRIPAGKSLSFGADFPSPRSQDASVELRITVAPKAFYERVFARTLAEETHLPAAAATQLREALADARASRYILYRIRRPVRE
jgi:hypothetical protein